MKVLDPGWIRPISSIFFPKMKNSLLLRPPCTYMCTDPASRQNGMVACHAENLQVIFDRGFKRACILPQRLTKNAYNSGIEYHYIYTIGGCQVHAGNHVAVMMHPLRGNEHCELTTPALFDAKKVQGNISSWSCHFTPNLNLISKKIIPNSKIYLIFSL